MTGTWASFAVPDSSTGTFTADIMLLLTDGSVLVHNGYTTALTNASQWLRLTPDHDGKYQTGSWSSELNMNFARQWFASGVLRDGRVFVIGGEDSTAGSDTPTGEIFDPLTNHWSNLSKPSSFDFVRGDCNGSVLSDGRVLIGGATPSGAPPSWRTAIWDPHADHWMEAGLKFGVLSKTDKEDPFEEETFVMLRDGSVLVPAVRDTPKAQRYVQVLDEWLDVHNAPVKLAIDTLKGTGVFETGPSILLPDGRVFAVGGTGATAIFTPGPHLNSPGSWVKGPVFPPDTSASPNWPTLTALDAPACLLPNGKVVCLGGTTEPDAGDYFSRNPVFFEFDPKSSAASFAAARRATRAAGGELDLAVMFSDAANGPIALQCPDQSALSLHPRSGEWTPGSRLEASSHRSFRVHGPGPQLSLVGYTDQRTVAGGLLWRRRWDGDQLSDRPAQAPGFR